MLTITGYDKGVATPLPGTGIATLTVTQWAAVATFTQPELVPGR